MPNIRILAFTDDKGQMALLKSGGMIGDLQLQVISNGMLHALVVDEPISWPWQNPERVKVERLMDYHRMLGAVTTLEKVIPASFDSVFEQPASVHQALAQHQRDILDLLGRFGASRQFSLLVRWDSTTMNQLMQRHAGTKNASIEKERRTIRDQILMQLQRHLQDIIILENHEEDVVLQAVLLTDAVREEKLVAVLRQIDAECCGRLDMRLIGPLPACNFARVEIKLPSLTTVRQACRDHGISPTARLSDLKTAYRLRVKNLHPDHRTTSDGSDVMVRLTQSYRYLARLAQQQNTGSENDPEKQWLRCDRKALRQTPLMHIQRGVTRWDDAHLRRL
jgi:DnaJ-domain-containing protein 1